MELIAYALYPGLVLPIVPAARERPWMDRTVQRTAYRCLPMSIANRHGWHVLSNQHLRVTWNGSPAPDGVTIEVLEGDGQCWAMRNFGDGIVTWMIPYLFRTPSGINLLARGPANAPKDGVAPLEGIVETDWACSTFTMNWKLTRPHHPVEFAIGEPICLLVPQPREMLESLEPVVTPLDEASETGLAYRAWADRRVSFRDEMSAVDNESVAKSELWQKDYFFGKRADGSTAEEHQTALRLARFRADAALRAQDAFADGGLEWAEHGAQ